MKGTVVKKNANQFDVFCEDSKRLTCLVLGKHKENGIFVGDDVEVDFESGVPFISQVKKRKNLLVRPPVANISQLIIVVAPKPKPDFLLVDKLILLAFSHKISPIICINKIDVATKEFIDDVKSQFSKVAQIVCVSALEKRNLVDLIDLLKNNISAFAGQSAVGKSHLTNSLTNKTSNAVGELSQKIDRGKNTTRHTEIFPLDSSSMIVDTAGFSLLDEELINIDFADVWRFYPEFEPFANECKYRTCTHTKEVSCAVLKAVENGKINSGRFERFLKIREEIKIRRTKYGK